MSILSFPSEFDFVLLVTALLISEPNELFPSRSEIFKHDFPKHAALLLNKSIPVPLDLLYLDTIACERYAFLSVGWGIIADIDIESEKFRSFGETRFTVGGLQRLLGMASVRQTRRRADRHLAKLTDSQTDG